MPDSPSATSGRPASDSPDASAGDGVGLDGWDAAARQLLGLAQTPAYLRRARQVEDALEGLRGRCRRQRGEWLEGVRLRLRMWHAAAANAGAFVAAMHPSSLAAVALLDAILLRPGEPRAARSAGYPKPAWRDLAAAVVRFNQRWSAWLPLLPLDDANRAVARYNQHYVLEKECLLRSPLLARRGYSPLPPVDHSFLAAEFPLLPALPADPRSPG